MGAHSRNKGAAGEREIARILEGELGIKFSRDLRQYQVGLRGDLIPEDDAFPFLIEVKRAAKGWTCKPEWERQVADAAADTGADVHPVVLYRFDGLKWRARVYADAVAESVGAMASRDNWFDCSVETFAWIAREIMARRAT